jgi:hypothetical protein
MWGLHSALRLSVRLQAFGGLVLTTKLCVVFFTKLFRESLYIG